MSQKKTNNKLGVVVPYRDRYHQLVHFKTQIKKYLDKKGYNYVLIVVEQDDAKLFNRGTLLNIGFEEALREKCNYVVFHDVDLIPVKVDYSFSRVPQHLATDFISDDPDFHRTIFDTYFGGVTIFPTDVFQIINGYSNVYWGWGFEDDDLFKRCVFKGIPYDTKTINVEGGPQVALKYNGTTSISKGKFKTDLRGKSTIVVTFHPDHIECDIEKDYDRHTVFSIPSIGLTLSYDSFRRYKFLMEDGEEWSYIDSELTDPRKTTVVLKINGPRKTIEMYQDGEYIGKTKFEKDLPDTNNEDFYIGCKNEEEELFRGIISQFAVYNDLLNKDNLLQVTKNTKYSLTMPFESYNTDGNLVQYYDMRYIKEYKVMDLIDHENPLEVADCEIINYEFIREHIIKVPFRRRGYFETLSHESAGYKNGSWTDMNIRYNQMRFHNEMEKGYRNYEEDGLSNLEYTLHSRSKVNNQIHLNVGI